MCVCACAYMCVCMHVCLHARACESSKRECKFPNQSYLTSNTHEKTRFLSKIHVIFLYIFIQDNPLISTHHNSSIMMSTTCKLLKLSFTQLPDRNMQITYTFIITIISPLIKFHVHNSCIQTAHTLAIWTEYSVHGIQQHNSVR